MRWPKSWTAHPRAGGENPPPGKLIGLGHGSSPRGRGKPDRLLAYRDHVRLIPARAGKTKGRLPYAAVRQAHPRAGGENFQIGIPRSASWGSSPRGRGKRLPACAGRQPPRLIPARAGKTCPSGHTGPCWSAHPRAGGENPSPLNDRSKPAGSSPRGRGKPGVDARREHGCGLIPARAGKTPPPRMTGTAPGAHPRAGGENLWVFVLSRDLTGSSPRGRGKRRFIWVFLTSRGLIPARAGKTRQC